MTDSLTLALRVGFSFTVVLGLMWAAARAMRGRYGERGAGTLEVLARQQVGRNASVAVLRVGDHALVLGVTEQGVSLLGDPITDLTPFGAKDAETASPNLRVGRRDAASDEILRSKTVAARHKKDGALDGSLLSPATWRQPLDALRDRTVRRG